MQRNCDIDTADELYVFPTLNQSGPPRDKGAMSWSSPVDLCDRKVTLSSRWMNCSSFSMMYNVATATLRDLNKGLNCKRLENSTYCLPEPCEVATVWQDGGIVGNSLIAPGSPYSNISRVQFMKWNAGALNTPAMPGDWGFHASNGPSRYCVPVYIYYHGHASIANPPRTASNYGLYYETKAGDYCNLLALNFSITFVQLGSWKLEIDSNCSNLWVNASYCAALVDGTTVWAQLMTTTQPTAAPSIGTAASSTSTVMTSKFVPAPGPTQPSATSDCYEWYVAKSGEECYAIYTEYSITFAQMRIWNPYLDENYSNLWPNYAHCVNGA